MQLYLLFLYPFINSIMNRWPRGTYSWGPWVTSAVLTILVLLITTNYLAAGAFFLTYVAGESFGWGKWLTTVPYWNDKTLTQEMYNAGEIKASGTPLIERDDGKNNGVHLLANLLCKETKDFRGYAWWSLLFRGVLWYAPIVIALTFLGAIKIYIAPFVVLIIAFAFPLSYGFAHKIFGDKYWTAGELIFGFIQGLTIAIALAVGIYL